CPRRRRRRGRQQRRDPRDRQGPAAAGLTHPHPRRHDMKTLNFVTLALLVIGGLNWGLVGAFQFDLVAALFGGQDAILARVVYALVGLSAVWQIGAQTSPAAQPVAMRRA